MEVLFLLVAAVFVGALVLGTANARSRPRPTRRTAHDDGSSALLHTPGLFDPHFGAGRIHAGDSGDRGEGSGGDCGTDGGGVDGGGGADGGCGGGDGGGGGD